VVAETSPQFSARSIHLRFFALFALGCCAIDSGPSFGPEDPDAPLPAGARMLAGTLPGQNLPAVSTVMLPKARMA